jgi:serine/threonine-protein kinase
MKVCPNCQNKYPDDGNFCPREGCATAEGPRRLIAAVQDRAQERIPEPPQRFVLESPLGGSASGEVWQARDNQSGETVAYKLVSPLALPTQVAIERAQRELKQLMRSQNPRVAKVIDCGKAPDGRLFIASELCAGEPLEQLLQRTGALPLDRAKKLIAQIGEALLEGQKVGVVHHDLAPKNVLVDADDQVKLINFVAARPLSEKIFGVPEFLSPEQAEGKLVDQRSNTYSLGAILTTLLTGAPPFTGATPEAVLEQILHAEVTPPSQRKADLTPEIDRVILKALDRNSSRRPLTMRQFLNDVASLQLGGAAAAPVGGRTAAVGLAKTMLFAGGATEARKLVAEATAARAEANGSGPVAGYSSGGALAATAARMDVAAHAATPAPPVILSPVEAPAQPVAAAYRGHGAAVAATMVALPASSPSSLGVPARAPLGVPIAPEPHVQATPPPVAAVRSPDDPAPVRKGSAAQGQGPNFRETLWFKKGDVEQLVAEAKAKAAAGGAAVRVAEVAPVELPVEEGKPLEDRYVDDGTLTVEDRKNFSLRSGGTSTALPVIAAGVPGDRMSEAEMLNEIGGRKKTTIIAISAVAAVAAVAALFFVLKGKGSEKGVAQTTTVTKPADESPAPATSKPPTTAALGAPSAPAGAEPDSAHAKEGGPAKEAPAARARSAKKKAAKKAAAKKKH